MLSSEQKCKYARQLSQIRSSAEAEYIHRNVFSLQRERKKKDCNDHSMEIIYT
jgi:hypothetical protein